MTTLRRGTFVVLVAFLAAGLAAACGSSESSASGGSATTRQPGTTVSPAPGTASTTPTTAAHTSTSAASTSSTASGGTATCPTSQLTAALQASQGAAGHIFAPLTLTNHGSTPCALEGYPGVSLLDGSGAQINSAATRATRPVAAVELAPGRAAQTDVETQDQGITPGRCWPTSTSLKVYPPGQLDALTIPATFLVCGDEFTVTPMAAA